MITQRSLCSKQSWTGSYPSSEPARPQLTAAFFVRFVFFVVGNLPHPAQPRRIMFTAMAARSIEMILEIARRPVGPILRPSQSL